MKKSFLSLALLIPALATAHVRVDVKGHYNCKAGTKTVTGLIEHTVSFDSVGDTVDIENEQGILTYTLAETDENAAVIVLEVSRKDEDGDAELIASPEIKAEWDKETTVAIINEDTDETATFTLTAHQE